MSVAPLPRARAARLATPPTITRRPPSRRGIAARGIAVRWTKRLLPLLALLLLGSVAMWPEIARQFDTARITYRKGGLSGIVQAGKLLDVRYHGVDARNRPYTVTADSASQSGPERIDLQSPKGDILSESGAWTYVEAEKGVFMQHTGQLDVSGKVTVYRDNGVTLHTDAASLDLKVGAAAGRDPTHTEGPFGQLDSANGFALVDKGAVIQFDGKSRLLLNEAQR